MSLSISEVTKIYQMGSIEVPALRGVSFDVEQKEYVAIIPDGKPTRSIQRPESFLIDPDGVLAYASRFQKVKTHGEPQAVIDLIERAHRTLAVDPE